MGIDEQFATNGGATATAAVESEQVIAAEIEEPASDPLDGLLVGRDSEIAPVVSVVLPTMDEETGISHCIDLIEQAIIETKLPTEIIVSDSSTDRTPDIARERGAIVVEPDKRGYGYAYRYAFEHARGDYIVMGDADATYDFSEIPRLLDHLHEEKADIVLGSRLTGEIRPGAMPALHQYVGNPLLTWFLNVFYDAGVSDAHSGFRVFRREALDEMNLKSNGMEFASEMVMKASTNSLAIAEVPITYHERVGEATLESFRDGWRHVRFMLVNAPGYLFSVPATAFGLAGVSMMLVSLINIQFSGIFFGAHTALMGGLLSIVGFQAGSLAVFSAVTTNPIQAQDDGLTQWIRANVRLEHGIGVGLALFIPGAVYLAVAFVGWATSSAAINPMIVPNILAFTAVVLGLQTVFSSFFLSMIAKDYE